MRTHTCGELRKEQAGEQVTLCGWADNTRLHGKIGFIDIRDRYGMTQVFFDKRFTEQLLHCRRESAIKITGEVKVRPQANPNLETGEVEVSADSMTILNNAEPLPLELDESINSTEDTRLTYRYLDLRRPKLQQNLVLRHKLIKAMRDYMDGQGFLEIETPLLAKSTPEGARDYLVPSRIQQGKFYALPQSPQLFKQILMVAGLDKYFQIAKCLRDEDLRADRQPEFTQLDAEMSFVDQEDVFAVVEGLLAYAFKEVLGKELEIPFKRLPYDEAMQKYKSDKPDLRKEEGEFAFVWIVDFPLFEYSKEEGRYVATHHPFCMPDDLELFEKSPEKVKGKTYDLVLNGVEILSGSIRIHIPELQRKVFKVLELSDEEVEQKFGLFLKAFSYGAPPHGGFAIGLDRLIQIIAGAPSIREVIAFPKNKDAADLMLDSPSTVSKEQMELLGLHMKK